LLKAFPILLPPLPEQKAIADLLATWDAAIEKTERLIEAKERRFRGLMQELLYEPIKKNEWSQFRASDLFDERRESGCMDLPLLSITGERGVSPRQETDRKDTSSEDKSKYLKICPGDIGYNTMRMWQGVSALSTLEGIVSPAYTICILRERLISKFVAYLFKLPFMIHRFYQYSQGLTSDTWNLKFRHFGEVLIPAPSIKKQKEICELLEVSRAEVQIVRGVLEQYKIQKRGLMQKLLTGEWRVDVKNNELMERATSGKK
jgi:type I restriction enzyme S subunit